MKPRAVFDEVICHRDGRPCRALCRFAVTGNGERFADTGDPGPPECLDEQTARQRLERWAVRERAESSRRWKETSRRYLERLGYW